MIMEVKAHQDGPSGNAFDLYSGGTRFESNQGNRLSSQGFRGFLVFWRYPVRILFDTLTLRCISRCFPIHQEGTWIFS
jgi:hypothetical protein